MTEYGTPTYYQEIFGDVVCCIGDEDCNVDNVVIGFVQALDEQEAYHRAAIDRIHSFRNKLAFKLQ